MKLSIYQVDAFADSVFVGNPAAVVPLTSWHPDALLQAIAQENSVSETAFFVPVPTEGENVWQLRWFTPAMEVDLCGHGTLAAAFVLARLQPGLTLMRFKTKNAGDVAVRRLGEVFTLDFPSRPPEAVTAPAGLQAVLGGAEPVEVLAGTRDYLVTFADAAAVRALKPDFNRLRELDRSLIVTAPGTGSDADVDFVSRFFSPGEAVPEDPVTGSAHCTLAPFWARRLEKDTLEARQVSFRGGRLSCRVDGDRVHIGGRAVLYLEGTIRV